MVLIIIIAIVFILLIVFVRRNTVLGKPIDLSDEDTTRED